MKTESNDGQVDLVKVFEIMWRGRLFIFAYSLLGLAVSFLYLFHFATPKYAASTMLALEAQREQVVNIETVVTGVSSDAASLNTELEVIKSRLMIEKVVDSLELTNDPEFNSSLRSSQHTAIEKLQSATNTLAKYVGLSPKASGSFPSESDIKNSVIANVKNAIRVENPRNTFIFIITAETESSLKSKTLANALAEAYIDDQILSKTQATDSAVEWLSERVVDLEMDLRLREKNIDELRNEMDFSNPEAVAFMSQRARDARDRLKKHKSELNSERQKLEKLKSLDPRTDRTEIASLLQDQNLNLLLMESDDISRNNFSNRVSQIQLSLEEEIQRGEVEERLLYESLQVLETGIAENSAQSLRLAQLEREAEAASTLYETFLTRLKEATVQIGLQKPDSRILSVATPGVYIAPNKGIVAFMGLFSGLVLGSLVAFMRQNVYSGFRSVDEIEAVTGLPAIGQTPLIPIKNRSDLLPFLEANPMSAAAEAMRNLRTSLLMAKTDKPPQVVMITSAVPGDGKTTQALSLAHNMTKMGKRVLLIDGDVRRATLNNYFNTEVNFKGIISAMTSDVSLDEIVYKDQTTGIEVVLAERSSSNAVDLLTSQNFSDLIEFYRKTYDHIIIDTAPVLAVPDARIVARYADSILVSVAWNATARGLVKEAIRQFDLVNIGISGLVLTKIDSDKIRAYGYSSYSSYGQGYYKPS
ncbi:polysaccharide biosynthesis tyrosine autokinase [Sagittula sp. SSi028]|uniref:polysaccharide biosynthesis tyrosine autokinase n=1 Tax=Sagittula sp. SSi028 TaxID=3400636 RepID=UPI003AF992E3